VVIHSRECIVPKKTAAGLVPLPLAPQMWIPVMGLPSMLFPETTSSVLFGYAAWNSFIHRMWSS
jgi:hypothetical protein